MVQRLLDAGCVVDDAGMASAMALHRLEVVEVLLRAGARPTNEDMVNAVVNGHVALAEQVLLAGCEGGAPFWRAVRKAGLAPRLVMSVPPRCFAALPPPVQPIWVQYHLCEH